MIKKYKITENQIDNIPSKHQIPEQQALKQFYSNTDEVTITWLGHACFLIKLGDINLLTDPFLSKTAGFFGIGPSNGASTDCGSSI